VNFFFDAGANARGKFGRELANRISRDPRLALGLIAVTQSIIGAGPDVLAPTIGAYLEEPRSVAFANSSDHLLGAVRKPRHVRSVEFVGGKPERFRAAANVGSPLPTALMGVNRIAIV